MRLLTVRRLFCLTVADYSSLSYRLRSSEDMAASSSLLFEDRAKKFYTFDEVQHDSFRTTHLSPLRHRSSKAAYGGLIFSQALAAAENTVETNMKPHAMHSFFLLNVDTSLPVQYNVRRVRDGRSFSTRTVEAVQEGKTVFIFQVSFHTIEPDSAVHQDDMPDVPSWKDLKSVTDLVPWLKAEVAQGRIKLKRPVERWMNSYDDSSDGKGDANAEERGDLFEIRPCSPEKAKGSLGDCEKLHRYLVVYNTDSTMAGTAYRPHFVNNFEMSMLFTLDHNVWMHQHDVRADQWMLFENTSTVAGKGRAFVTGKLWSEDGVLLLSCTQEVVLRTRGDVSRI
ncbi:hypothetical protein Q1695_010726 [Nippostrongylus brasiliensis]|nr:hypothetical protein Q1695_010726 [Nippostrongylus brasiliensis]